MLILIAEFHSQTAIEAAKHIHAQLKGQGKTAEDIKDITIRTHEACVRIIDKQFKPMDNFADRDHCIQVRSLHIYEVASKCCRPVWLTDFIVHGSYYARVQPPRSNRLYRRL